MNRCLANVLTAGLLVATAVAHGCNGQGEAVAPRPLPRAVPQEAEKTSAKRAALIGINAYKHGKLPPLQFAENDVQKMADFLKTQGYSVDLLTGDKATKSGVESLLKNVLAGCEKGDTVLVGLSGHGLQFLGQKDAFYVPVDGLPFRDETDSLVSLNGVYDRLEKSFAGIKVLLVDACRDDPQTTKGIDADTAPRPPQGVAALFSCKAGERAFEHKSLQHGVFFHHVLEGLKGKAVDSDGEVTFSSLAGYVTKNVSRSVPQLIDGAKQSPNVKADYSAEPVLAKIDLKPITPTFKPTSSSPISAAPAPAPVPAGAAIADGKTAGEERVFSDLKIKMIWCPPGKFTMGSPKSEEGRYDNEDQVEVTLSRGFWLGQTEVTQGLWESVMGTTPWKGKTDVKEGANYPATEVSHTDAVDFCAKLTDRERKAGRLAGGMKYRLPTEAEWEYACRAGTTTMYSFGADATKLSDHAWWGGYYGDGNAKTEQYAHQVGTKRANAWGLYDMHGNVWECCGDWYADKLAGGRDPRGPLEGSNRVFRGGSWLSNARGCRSADRHGNDPVFRGGFLGFRVLLSPSK